MPVASSPPAIEISSASGSEVMLRPPSSGTRDPNKRKSGMQHILSLSPSPLLFEGKQGKLGAYKGVACFAFKSI